MRGLQSLNYTLIFYTGGEDYVDSFASLMFSDDRPDNYILNITILEDRVAEAGENFTVSLVVPDALSQHVIFASGAEASIQIIDNDGMSCVYVVW